MSRSSRFSPTCCQENLSRMRLCSVSATFSVSFPCCEDVLMLTFFCVRALLSGSLLFGAPGERALEITFEGIDGELFSAERIDEWLGESESAAVAFVDVVALVRTSEWLERIIVLAFECGPVPGVKAPTPLGAEVNVDC